MIIYVIRGIFPRMRKRFPRMRKKFPHIRKKFPRMRSTFPAGRTVTYQSISSGHLAGGRPFRACLAASIAGQGFQRMNSCN
jgi:hypothetical protein